MPLSTVINRVVRDIRRNNLTDDISNHLESAIRAYSSRRFYFNDLRQTLSLSIDQEVYTTSHLSSLGDWSHIDLIEVNDGNSRWPLDPITPDKLNDRRAQVSGNGGDPVEYCYFGNSLILSPVPNRASLVLTIWGTRDLGSLSSTASGDNAWTTDAADLIATRTEVNLYRYVIKDFVKADQLEKEELKEVNRLRAKTNRLLSTNRVRPYGTKRRY